MGQWYKVTKHINGRSYLYWQRTHREGRSVKTENRYIGPAAGHASSPAPSNPTKSTRERSPVFVPVTLSDKERRDDERLQYGPLEDRIARQKARIRAAKKISGRFKPLNYFIGKLISAPKKKT